jgi:membrane-associated protease RseP (regulator of RpoE activity)
MLESATSVGAGPAALMMIADSLTTVKAVVLIFIGFSLVIFVHELGHFLMAKLCDVKVDRFAIGFGRSIFTYRRGMGFRAGATADEYRRRLERHIEEKRESEIQFKERIGPSEAELAAAGKELGLGETEYAFNALPLGGYVKMLGQEDFAVDKTGELVVKDNPRSFTNKPVSQRMLIVSAGVVMNLIFALLCFMAVFMIGYDLPTPEVGLVIPGSPAEQAGLQFGDRVLEIEGRKVRDYDDIRMAVVLAEPHEPLTFVIKRDGKTFTREITPEYSPEANLLQIGVSPRLTRKLVHVEPEPGPPRDDALKEGDVFVSVNGVPVRDFYDVMLRLMAARGGRVKIVVDRPDPDNPGHTKRVTCTRAARLTFAKTSNEKYATGHLLGLVPRRQIGLVYPGTPAETYGFKPGDVIARWDTITAPTWAEIAQSILSNPDTDIDVVIERGGQTLHKLVRPERIGLFGQGKPQVGFDPSDQEEDKVVVAAIVETVDGRPTPAAALASVLPRGALLTHVNGEPVRTWQDLIRCFRELAGQEVTLTWRFGNEPAQTHPFFIPESLGTRLDLSPVSRITDIGGKDAVVATGPDGKPVEYSAHFWKGARELLRRWLTEHPGKPVTVRYRDLLDPEGKVITKQIDVSDDMLDPWTMRIKYTDNILPEIDTTCVQTWNPFVAFGIGARKTYDFVMQAYLTMKRMVFTRSVGVENISGPVGIINMGVEIAKSSTVKLVFFLGFLSANLAVINFLPMPIVDGGLMVFLLIEKIKGRPVSIKTQMVTQIIGLALIIAAFVFVTYLDITKL